MQNDFPTRLKYFRSLRDLTQVELAKRVGISSKQISDYEVGTSRPRQSTYIKILNALDISDHVFGNSDLCSLDINDLEDDQIVSFNNDKGDKIILSREFCTANRLYPDSSLSVYKIKGDAMAETLLDGDLVLVDTAFHTIISGHLHLIFIRGEKMAARLFCKPNGIDVIKDNSAYPSWESIGESEITVLGKIVFRQGLI